MKPAEMPEKCEALEDLRWSPGVSDCDLLMYLRAARSMAAFAGMCDGGCAEDGCVAASRDDTTINAMDTLHESYYDTGKALQALVKNPIPPGIEKKWVEDEQKRFVKGLRQYGKNFFKIRKELLPHKETADLVEFYYLWKKSPGAVTSRTHRRNRRQTTLRRIKPSPRPNRPASNDYMDASSGSGDEGEDSEDSDSRGGEIAGYTCQNCFTTTSKDWLPVGKDLAVTCTECRLYYKKHGEMPPVTDTKESLPYLFQPVKEEDGVNGKHVMKTRRSKERQSPKTVIGESGTTTPKGGRKSPGAASNCSTSSTDRGEKKKKLPQENSKVKKKIKEEIKTEEVEADDDKSAVLKKKINRSESPSESVCTESSASNEENVPDADGMSSPSPSLGPSPALSPSPSLPQMPVKEGETESIVRPEEEEPPPVSNIPFENSEVQAPVTVKEEFIPPPLIMENAIQVKQEVISTDEKESMDSSVPMETTPMEEPVLPPIEKVKEEIPSVPRTPSPVAVPPTMYEPPLASQYLPVVSEEPTSASTDNPVSPPPGPIPPEQPPAKEESMLPLSLQYPGPLPQSIKMEPVDMQASPPPPPLPVHETIRHASYSHTSSTAHFSNNLSISMSNSSLGSTGSISASSSISVSYHGHSKMPYPNHSSLIASSQSSLSAFNYRPFSPHYPYSPGLPPFPHLPSQQQHQQQQISQQAKMKYSPPHSPTPSHSPPPTSSPYGTGLPVPPYGSSTMSPKPPLQGDTASSCPVQVSQHNAASVISPPVSTQATGSSSHTLSTSNKQSSHIQPMSQHSGPNHGMSQKQLPQPAHQSSYYPQSAIGNQSVSQRIIPGHHPMQRMPHMMPSLHGQGQVLPTPAQHLPPTSYVANLPPQLPFSQSQLHGHPDRNPDADKCVVVPEQVNLEEEEEQEPHFVSRGPSPEPRVDDSECHRSQSAIFLRHWNRGECSSCARTDLTFKPVPDSKLARKREERARKAAEREREESKARLGSTPDNKPGSSSQGDGHHLSPFDRHMARGGPDTPALRQLGEYARPHAASFAPGYARPPGTVAAGNIPLGVLPHGIDPILHYQLSSGMYGAAARERYTLEMEMEREKRERDLHDKLKAEYEMKSRLPPGAYDPHWIELQRRYGALQAGPSVGLSPGHPGVAHGPFGLYSPAERERMGIPQNVPVSEAATMERINAERVHSERLMLSTDPLLRLQMAGLAPELHTHAHTHAHAHTHLHLHPHDAVSAAAAAAAAMGVPPHSLNEPPVHPSSSSHPLLPPTGYASGGPRQSIVPRTELLHPAAGMLRPPYDDQLAHQLSAQLAHEQMQRQLLLERERYAHMGGPIPHPSQLLSQQDEFMRQQQQRERELKLRTLEEAARGGRPPMN